MNRILLTIGTMEGKRHKSSLPTGEYANQRNALMSKNCYAGRTRNG